jgi:hypothetical protein
VILLANVVTNAAERHRLRLTESRVYTIEAFTTYLSRLRHEGRLALVLYDEATLTRALTTALEALVRGGHADDHGAALLHTMVVLDASAQPSVPILTVRRTPYTREEAIAAARVAEARGWALVLVPHLLTPERVGAAGGGRGGPRRPHRREPGRRPAPHHRRGAVLLRLRARRPARRAARGRSSPSACSAARHRPRGEARHGGPAPSRRDGCARPRGACGPRPASASASCCWSCTLWASCSRCSGTRAGAWPQRSAPCSAAARWAPRTRLVARRRAASGRRGHARHHGLVERSRNRSRPP